MALVEILLQNFLRHLSNQNGLNPFCNQQLQYELKPRLNVQSSMISWLISLRYLLKQIGDITCRTDADGTVKSNPMRRLNAVLQFPCCAIGSKAAL